MILLDTCAVLFEALGSRALTPTALHAVDAAEARGELLLLDVSLAEISQLVQVGRLRISSELLYFLEECVAQRDVKVLPVTAAIAARQAALVMHKDPADRLIAAATLVHGAQLVTSDERLRALPWLPTVW